MELQVYLAFVKDAKNNPFAGPLIASDSIDAQSKAIEKCKAKFGKKSKLTMLKHIGSVTSPQVHNSEIAKALDKFDQIIFRSVNLEKLMQETVRLLSELRSYFENLQSQLNGE